MQTFGSRLIVARRAVGQESRANLRLCEANRQEGWQEANAAGAPNDDRIRQKSHAGV